MNKAVILAVLMLVFLCPAVAAEAPSESAVYTVHDSFTFSNSDSKAVNNVTARIFLLDNHSGWADQRILAEEIEVDGEPVDFQVSSTQDNRILHIFLGSIDGWDSKTITVTQVVKVSSVEISASPELVYGNIPGELMEYTEPVPYLWESDDPEIRAKAIELTENENNLYLKAMRIFDFVKSYLTYHVQSQEHSAKWAYSSRVGDCTEFTNLFIAMARAAGIPAKFVSAYGYKEEAMENSDRMGHAFAIIYLPNIGWIPVDEVWRGGQLGEMSCDKLVESTDDGKNMVDGTQIKLPGKIGYNYQYTGTPSLNLDSSSTITKDVAVELRLDADSRLEDNVWKFFVTIKNVGKLPVENLEVKLEGSDAYFNIPPAQTLEKLESGRSNVLTFSVGIKQSLENVKLSAHAVYDSQYGELSAKGEIFTTATLPSHEDETMFHLLLVVVVIVLVASISVIVAKR